MSSDLVFNVVVVSNGKSADYRWTRRNAPTFASSRMLPSEFPKSRIQIWFDFWRGSIEDKISSADFRVHEGIGDEFGQFVHSESWLQKDWSRPLALVKWNRSFRDCQFCSKRSFRRKKATLLSHPSGLFIFPNTLSPEATEFKVYSKFGQFC